MLLWDYDLLSSSYHLFITQTVFIKCYCSLSKLHPRIPRRLHAGSMLSHCTGHMLKHRMHMQRVGQGWSFYTVTNVKMEGQNQKMNCLLTLIMTLCQAWFVNRIHWGGGGVNLIFVSFFLFFMLQPKLIQNSNECKEAYTKFEFALITHKHD